ncbi:YbaB/EbfC family nucleoid-associated protein [Amycolatopsis sp. H20-H5]|uniref:YbaB/EbfC family nucleoid-associated protein n=1 Tax=Amycolatopsis sp. H20-H5 TaxID=3046309 RepID=UPI002DBC64D6|nr:YbaB/EbfC family nucleoid-associated protein [Amycolatopsis sp. H20-H5]MEC3980722.1 YbaB/EbfC family nucleoid-associated protein [Amycolatopsis sp. H20-H5]
MTSANGIGDFVTDPDEAIRRMDQWAQGFADKAQRYQAAQERTEQLRLTATSSDGAVRVTVGADGGVTGLEFSNKARSFPLDELSRQILATMHRAQSGIADQVAGVMAEQLGDEDPETRSLVLDNLRSRFPDPDEEPGDEPDDGPGPDTTPPPVPPAAPGPAPQPPASPGVTPPGPPPRRRPGAAQDEDNNPW